MRHHPLARSLVYLAATAIASAPVASAQWSTDPAQNTVVASGAGEQVLPKLASTADGGCYIGWFDNGSGAYTVRLQRLDAAGVAQWGANGILVSANPQSTSLVDWALIADSAGNAVITFTDTRDGGDLDVFAYRVAPSGAQLWGANGVQLSTNSDYEPSPRVAETSSGDFVFVWARLPSGGDGRVFMQRVSPAGAPHLAPGGIPIVTQAGESPAFSDVVAAESGSVIVSWVRSIKTFASPRHVRARKFAADGTSPWATHVNVFDATSVPIAYLPVLRSDDSGGAVLSWHRSDGGGLFNSFVQRLDGDGVEAFAHNGVAVATTTTNHIDPAVAFDPASLSISVFWNERNSAQSQWGIYGQRIDAGGNRLWGSGGAVFVPVNTTLKYSPRAVPIGDSTIVTYADEPTGLFGKDRALAFRVDPSGSFAWPSSPRVIASTLATKSRLPTVIDCTGNVRAVWEDDRNGTPDLYAQAIHHDGALGGAPPAFTDLGFGLPGSSGTPSLLGAGNLCPNTTVTLTLGNALPNSSFALILGLSQAQLPLLGGTLVPAPGLVFTGLPTGPTGTLALAGVWPPGVPSGLAIFFQCWIADAGGPAGAAASNGLRAIAP